jgi:hypothetical protein
MVTPILETLCLLKSCGPRGLYFAERLLGRFEDCNRKCPWKMGRTRLPLEIVALSGVLATKDRIDRAMGFDSMLSCR